MLSNSTNVLHPIAIAKFGTSDIPNLALADTYGYCHSEPNKVNGKNETKYMTPPAAALALAVSTQAVQCT